MTDTLSDDQMDLANNIIELWTSEQRFCTFIRQLFYTYVFRLAPTKEQATELINALKEIDQSYQNETFKHLQIESDEILAKEIKNLPCVIEPIEDDKQEKQAGYLSISLWTSLFEELPNIYEASLQLTHSLQQCLYKKEGQAVIDELEHVCKYLNEWITNIHPYDKYVTAYDYNLEKLRSVVQRNPNLQITLQHIKQSKLTEGLDLFAFIIMPVQRIPRYTLFLQTFKKKNKNQSIQTIINATYDNVQAKLQDIDKKIENHENLEFLRGLSRQIHGLNQDLVQPNRTLIRRGYLQKQCKKQEKKRMVYLFSDSLLYCTVGGAEGVQRWLKLPRLYPLRGCSCQLLDGERDKFLVLTGKKSFVLIAANEKERIEWAGAISGVIQKLESDVGVKSPLPSAIAPQWAPDFTSLECRNCSGKFTLFNRRHHCRACGNIVCNKCSSGRAILPNLSNSILQRVCDRCMRRAWPQWRGNASVGAQNQNSKFQSDSAYYEASKPTLIDPNVQPKAPDGLNSDNAISPKAGSKILNVEVVESINLLKELQD